MAVRALFIMQFRGSRIIKNIGIDIFIHLCRVLVPDAVFLYISPTLCLNRLTYEVQVFFRHMPDTAFHSLKGGSRHLIAHILHYFK